ncbi:ribonucleoside-diphosphate reductase subunit alpha [Amphritea sp. HPY]|uniref:ribonucleoside-diphosphate reductase subunit alpha n=1 Tax=Amphritea sp. HPY TaxID=3421652 RepID=UPI003D7D0A36
MKYNGIQLEPSRDNNLSPLALTLLNDFYLQPHEASPQQAFARAAIAFCGGDMELAQRIYDYASKGWLSFSSPILSNAPVGDWRNESGRKPFFFQTKRGKAMPISCFLSLVADNIGNQMDAAKELAALSISGGGVGQHFKMRGVTDKASGAIPYLKTADSNIMYYKQGKTRKGSMAAYLDIDHPDIVEFIGVRIPTGGDINRKCLNVNNAVNITDAFMLAVADDAMWDLKAPNDGKVVDTIRARELWQMIIETRFRTGEPYINYIDEANRHLPQAMKNLGLKIHGSNLCNEIHLPTSEELTAVCCLSSVNLEYFDEWSGTTMVRDAIRFLDNVIQYFLENAPVGLEKAVQAAAGSRDLGLGAMGFHSYLQRNGIAFESGGLGSAVQKNAQMFKYIKREAVAESELLATLRGEPAFLKGTGRRNGHLLAIAPNANSSIITGTSPSIEPWNANAFVHRTRAGSHVVRNKYLHNLLMNLGPASWVEEEWDHIMANDGSVQDRDYLTDEEKAIFKTARELDQAWLVEHGRIRQVEICQGQSLNLFFPAGTTKREVNRVHLKAFSRTGSGVPLKGLYYLRTNRASKTEQVSKAVTRDALKDYESQAVETEECLACQ